MQKSETMQLAFALTVNKETGATAEQVVKSAKTLYAFLAESDTGKNENN